MSKVDLARALSRRFPGAKTLTLARRLYDENKEQFKDIEQARTTLRRARGTHGATSRAASASKEDFIAPRKAGTVWECPPSLAEPWEPFVIARPKRTLILSDIHVPWHDKGAVEAAVAYGKEQNPTTVILNGDTIDFYAISRYMTNPKLRNLKAELDMTLQLLRWIRQEFPKAKLIYKVGNHDVRWDHFIWNKAPELWDLKQAQLHTLLEFDKLRITRVDDNPMMVGKLPVLHGHELPKGISNPVNPARGAFLRTLHSVLIGHLHQSSSHSDTNMFKKEIMTWSTGCLCELTPAYARINRWKHGFAFVEVGAQGLYDVHNLRVADGIVRSS